MNIDFSQVDRYNQKAAKHKASMNYLQQRLEEDMLDKLVLLPQPPQRIIGKGFSSAFANHQEANSAVEWVNMPNNPCDPVLALQQLADQQPADACLLNLTQGCGEYPLVFALIHHLVKPGGAFGFVCFGPDTLSNIQQAWQAVDSSQHVHDFPAMHDLGDNLLRAGFKQPMMDADWLTVDYPNLATLFADLRGAGLSNAHAQRRRGLLGKARYADFLKAIKDQSHAADDTISTTYEVIFGFGLVPESSGNQVTVHFS